MRIFCIKFNEFGYDEYKGFVVAAENEKEVLSFIEGVDSYGEINWEGGYTMKELRVEDYKETTIILESYNAG